MVLLAYYPHSGFGNQMIELQSAIRLAQSLNATLVLPLILQHFDTTFGTCRHPTRVASAADLSRRYGAVEQAPGARVSVADVFEGFPVPTVQKPIASLCDESSRTLHLSASCERDTDAVVRQVLPHATVSCVVVPSTFSLTWGERDRWSFAFRTEWIAWFRKKVSLDLWDAVHFRLTDKKNAKTVDVPSQDVVPLLVLTDDEVRARVHLQRRGFNASSRRLIFSAALFGDSYRAVLGDALAGTFARTFYPAPPSSFSSFVTRMRRVVSEDL